MKKFLLSVILIFSSSLVAETCKYSYDKDSAKINGTGFKYTDKTGVTATFSEFDLISENSAKSLKGLIKKTKLTVNLQSIDSQNKIRDYNLKTTLLKNIKPVRFRVEDVSDNKILTSLTLNNITKEVAFDYKKNENKITATSNIDILNFNTQKNVRAMEKKCRELHTGKDGISKSWSDFNLKLEVTLITACDK